MSERAVEHVALEAEMRDFQARYRVLSTAMDKLEAQRGELYLRGRALDPPMTYKALAAIFEVTQAAIQQKERRILEARAAVLSG